MKKTKIAKIVAKNIVGWSTTFTINAALRNNVAPETPVQQVQLVIGSAVIGAVVAEATEAYTEKFIDDVVGVWDDLKKKS